MNWLLVIIAVNSGGTAIETVPYKDKLTCDIAALGAYTLNMSPVFNKHNGTAVTIDAKCILGPEG